MRATVAVIPLALVVSCALVACLFPDLGGLSGGDSGGVSAPGGAVLYFPFEEGAGSVTYDRSLNHHDGVLSDAGVVWTQGEVGNALAFNTIGLPDASVVVFPDDAAVGFVDVPGSDGGVVDGHASFTVAAWIFAIANPIDDAPIVSSLSKTDASGFQLDTTIDVGPRSVALKIVTATDDGGATTIARYGATPIALGEWYHVAGVYDAQALELHVYLNGVSDDGTLVGAVPSERVAAVQDLTIGKRPVPFVASFIGTIDEVRIYARALSPSEIGDLYQSN